MPDQPNLRDPFREARNKDGVLRCPFQGETLPMILRHADGARGGEGLESVQFGRAVSGAHPVRRRGSDDAAVAHRDESTRAR